jgi:hypothetical protein
MTGCAKSPLGARKDGSERAATGEADPSPAADDEVVEHLDADDLPCASQAPGDHLVVSTRLRIAGRMVVREDDRARVGEEGIAEDLAR